MLLFTTSDLFNNDWFINNDVLEFSFTNYKQF